MKFFNGEINNVFTHARNFLSQVIYFSTKMTRGRGKGDTTTTTTHSGKLLYQFAPFSEINKMSSELLLLLLQQSGM